MATTKLLLREVDGVDSEGEAVMGYVEGVEGSRHFPSDSATLFADQTTTFPRPFLLEYFLAEIAPLACNMDVQDAEALGDVATLD